MLLLCLGGEHSWTTTASKAKRRFPSKSSISTYWKWRLWSALYGVSYHFCVAEWSVWCSTMLWWCHASDSKVGPSPSSCQTSWSVSWNTVTEWTLFSYWSTYWTFVLSKLTVCHVQARQCRRNGGLTDSLCNSCQQEILPLDIPISGSMSDLCRLHVDTMVRA